MGIVYYILKILNIKFAADLPLIGKFMLMRPVTESTMLWTHEEDY